MNPQFPHKDSDKEKQRAIYEQSGSALVAILIANN